MRTYNKRIGFIVSYQTLIPHGGIGQFTKSFVEMMSLNNIKVDIITDKQPPNSEFVKEIEALGGTIIYPENPYAYTDHSAIFMYGDTFCYERMANIRSATILALGANLYDAIICNTYEAVQVVSTMGLDDCIQIIAYTHLESQIYSNTKNPFLHSTNEMMRKQLELSGLWIGTQSKHNQISMSNGAWHLPIPLPEKGLLQEHHTPRTGVLFVGRWEEGKNPELFIDLIEQTKLPARVMTSPTGVKKFEERLKKIGVDYKVVSSIIGQEKVDFITSCRVAFNPSTVESYGIAFLEQIIQLPTVALADQRWTQNFNSAHFSTATKKNMAKIVTDLYNVFTTAKKWYATNTLKFFQAQDADVFHKWHMCFLEFEGKKSSTNTAKILTYDTVKYKDYTTDLKRKVLCIDDIRSVLTNKHKFRVIYTATDTYLTKDPHFEPTEELTGMNLFEVT